MAGVSGGNLWSSESRAWNSLFLQTSSGSETQTVLPEMGNFSWGLDVTPNSAGSAENGASTVTNLSSSDLFANLGGEELADSPSLLDSAAFVDAQAWNQTLMRSRDSESVQNMQTSSDNLSESFFTRQKDLVTLPTEWELRNFGGEDPTFSTITNENGFSHFNNSAALSDLGSPLTLQAPDPQTLTRSLPAVSSFNDSFPPMPHLQLGRIKQECSMLDHGTSPNITLSQGLESHAYAKQHISDILEASTNSNTPFLKSMQGHCYSNGGQTFMQGEDQFPGLWSCSSNSSSTFPVSLSQILPTSSQPVTLLSTNRSSPLWDLIRSKQDLKPHHTAHNFQQFLQDGKVKMNSIAQHLTMTHADEARDSSNDSGKRCSNESSTSDTIFKRPRLDTTNCAMPTFKVRKEKLGDRITALQQLVSPFGKTDTASVLLEAIGYIKFLHEQVQVLSTPYLNSGATNSSQGDETGWVGISCDGKESDGAAKQDLRSRGLCLVPVSASLTVTNDNGADYWSPALGCNYR